MTPFTDADLQLLELGSRYFDGGEENGYRKMIVGLIARLEASERCAEALNRSRGQWIHSVNAKENLEALEAWREKCGVK